MEKAYRVIVECYDKNSPKKVVSQCSVLEGDINKPTNCMDFTIGIENLITDRLFIFISRLLPFEVIIE